MILLLILITITVSVGCEVFATLIYFMIVRRKLSEFNIEISFGWLPYKRKTQIIEYKKIIGENDPSARWVEVAIWLYKISWIALIISSLLVLFVVVSQ